MRLKLIPHDEYENISKKVRGINGLLDKPLKVNNNFFSFLDTHNQWEKGDFTHKVNCLLSWGIFNPFGPTICLVGYIENDLHKVEIVYFRSLNPFSQLNYIVSACDYDFEMDLVQSMKDLFIKFTTEEPFFIKSMPSIIFDPMDSLADHFALIFWEAYVNLKNDLSSDLLDLKQTLGNPWDLASLEMDRIRQNLKKKEEVILEDFRSEKFKPSEDEFMDYIDLLVNDENILGFLRNIRLAWEGAIKNSPLGSSALTFDKLNRELTSCDFHLFSKL